MFSFELRIALCLVISWLFAPIAGAADIGSDLKATIILQGYPCDEIAQKTRNADSNYNVSCKDGNRYHVFINPLGRVSVEKV